MEFHAGCDGFESKLLMVVMMVMVVMVVILVMVVMLVMVVIVRNKQLQVLLSNLRRGAVRIA